MITKKEFGEVNQLKILYCCVEDHQYFLKLLNVLKPEYFESPAKDVLTFMLDFWNKYHDVPSYETIKDTIGVALPTTLPDSLADLEHLVDLTEANAKHEAIMIAMRQSMDDYDDGKTGNIIKRFQDALSVAVRKSIGSSPFDDPQGMLKRMQAQIGGHSCGIKLLDEMMDYFRRSELVLIAGATQAGKSLVLANIARNMCEDGLNVLLLSLELSEPIITKRLYSVFTGISPKAVFDNASTIATVMGAIEQSSGKFLVKKIPNGATAADIRSVVQEFNTQYQKPLDVLLVDYLDLMRPMEYKGDGAFDRDKAITEELREVIVDFNLYGFTASQLNRDSVGAAKITHAHIAGGLSKLNTVDGAIGIQTPEDGEEDDGKRIFQQLKIRNGERYTSPIELYLDPKTLKLTDKSIHGSAKSDAIKTIVQKRKKESPIIK